MSRLVPLSAIPPTTSIAYVLRSTNRHHGTHLYYTGKSGADRVSPDFSQAFQFRNLDIAKHRARKHNSFAELNAPYFTVLALVD